MVNGVCVWCNDKLCDTCGATPAICETCVSFESDRNYGVKNDRPVYKDPATGKCKPCVGQLRSSGCLACNGQGRCSKCDDGFVLVNGACKKCKGGAECTACRPDSQQCTKCTDGYGFASPANKTCVPCATAGCNACPDFRTCTKCQEPMYLSRRNTCEECTEPFCDVCNRDGQCTSCSLVIDMEHGAYTLVGKTCKPCGVRDCERCVAGKPGICGVPQGGFYIADGGRKCVSCGNDCTACKDAQTCTQCENLSQVGGKCTRCEDPRCKDCTGNAAVCRTCKDARHVPDPNTKRCRLKVPPQKVGVMPAPGSGPGPRSRRLMGAPARDTSASATASAGSSKERPRPAIIGGQPAQKDRFPWAAQLRINDKSNLWPQFCGASLVHRQVLLTAAHCVVDNDAFGQWQPLEMSLPQIRLGAYQMNTGQYQERYGKWVLPHPLYRLTAIGWGYVDDQQTDPKVLMEVALPMVAQAQCQTAYPGQPWQAQFCAGDRFTKDTCQGDSGGPLFLKGANSTADMLVGVTSWGEGCAAGYPGVYSDVAYARKWIDASIQYLVSQEAAGRFPPAEPSK
ncbi:hypothetical protein COHA_006424 [Chlorella ohadii]|uniref:Peptidase S1 domain-containing protein n=1 Tax=Chlorella ohadii TaxID=2649997 RepID=A0AAD5H0T2_9CHLO|nr:hypothetical protein COHA_006424 [Chlorella ohadii]